MFCVFIRDARHCKFLPAVQVHFALHSADKYDPWRNFQSQLYMRCACARGRPSGMSALTQQPATDATYTFQPLQLSALMHLAKFSISTAHEYI